MQGQKPVKNVMDLSLGRKFYVESESEVKIPQIQRPDPENEEKLPPIFLKKSDHRVIWEISTYRGPYITR